MDRLTKEQRHKNMKAVKNKDSKIEILLRKALWSKGYRYRKNYTKLEDMSEFYKDAVIAVEDRRFYEHGAIDPIALARAIYSNIKAKELREGGSTITQQLAKNIYFTQEKYTDH